jgi:hypothetical protein
MPKRTGRDITANRRHLTVFDYRDTDLMAKVGEAGADGITTTDLAAEIGFDDLDGHRAVGMRFAWMKKYGMLAFDDKRRLWRLTDGADRVLASQKLSATQTIIERVPDEEMVSIMAHVTTRYRLGDPMVATLLRREFQYGTNPRSRVWEANRGGR